MDPKKAISMQKPKARSAARAAPAVSLVAQMRTCLTAIEIEGGAEIYPVMDRLLWQQAKAAPAGSARRRRLLAMRVALLGGAMLRLSEPEPVAAPVMAEVPAPALAPEPPKGVVNTVTLEDAAKMLFAAMGSDEDDKPAAVAPLKVDFSMFGEDDDSDPEPAAAASADFDPFAEAEPVATTEPVTIPAKAGIADFSDWDDAPEADAALDAPVDFDPFAALQSLPDAKASPLHVDFSAWDDENGTDAPV